MIREDRIRLPPQARFRLGNVVITANAVRRLKVREVSTALLRHVTGDWGDIDAEDRGGNERALRLGERLLSVYQAEDKTKFWIITEWDRSATPILLPEDY